MLRKSLIAAGLIVTMALLTACGSSAPKQEETTAATAAPAETVVAQEEATTVPDKVITDKNVSTKKTDTAESETTTKQEETETTAKETETQAEAETTTKAFAVAQSEDEGEAGEMEAFSAYYGVVSADGDGLTLREDADSNSGGLTLIPDGTEIAIEEVKDGWGRVNYDGMTGWVSLDYIE